MVVIIKILCQKNILKFSEELRIYQVQNLEKNSKNIDLIF